MVLIRRSLLRHQRRLFAALFGPARLDASGLLYDDFLAGPIRRSLCIGGQQRQHALAVSHVG